jgi:acetolactate decarboxylase
MKRHLGLFGLVLGGAVAAQLWSSSVSSAGALPAPGGQRRFLDRLVQIAPLDRLMAGGFDGTTTVAQVKAVADFGIGTFNGIDGEMVMLDGAVYQATASGILRVATPQDRIPFATLTRFRAEYSFVQSTALADYAALQSFLNASMPDQTQILAIKIHGRFATLKVRAPRKQVKPYPTLSEVLKTQAVFDLSNISGTLVGFRFPSYIGTVNSAGYHFHFVADDRRIGGHVLEISTSSITVAAETVEQYDITLE